MKDVLCVIICQVICLFVLSGTAKTDACSIPGDANGDGRVGLEDAVYALQVTSGMTDPPIDQEEKYKILAENALKSAYTAAQLYFVAEYPDAGKVTVNDLKDYGYIPVEGVELDIFYNTIWARHVAGGYYTIDNNGVIMDIDNRNFLAEVDIKKAYRAAQSFFKEYPNYAITVSLLADSGYKSSSLVTLAIWGDVQSNLSMETYHAGGDEIYSIDSAGDMIVLTDAVLKADHASLPADGMSQSHLTATFKNIPDGIFVSFRINGDGSFKGKNAVTARTVNNQAHATLTSGNIPGYAYVSIFVSTHGTSFYDMAADSIRIEYTPIRK